MDLVSEHYFSEELWTWGWGLNSKLDEVMI